MPDKTLTGACVPVRINKPPNNRIIVSALQVVQPGIPIIAIPAITEGVIRRYIACGLRDRSAACTVNAGRCAPGIIGVGCNQCGRVSFAGGVVIAAVQRNDIALQVLTEIVILPIGRRRGGIVDAKSNRAVAFVKEIPQDILFGTIGSKSLLSYRQTVYYIILRIAAVIVGLSCPNAAGVIFVAVGLTANCRAGKLPLGATGGLDLWHRIVRSVDVGKMRFIPSAPGNAVKEVLGYLSAEFCLGFLLQYLNTR